VAKKPGYGSPLPEVDERSEAVLLYLGFGPNYNHPRSSPDAVRQRFGDRAEELIAYAKALADETSDMPRQPWPKDDPRYPYYEMWLAAQCRKWFAERHPELDPAVVDAMGTAYAFWWR